jgi:hypothetical protein
MPVDEAQTLALAGREQLNRIDSCIVGYAHSESSKGRLDRFVYFAGQDAAKR